MDKVTIGLLGAVAGLATMGCTQAANAGPAPTPDPMQVSSYSDLLAPVPNAVEMLRTADAVQAQPAASGVRLADWNNGYGPGYGNGYGPGPSYHHHHHHNNYARNYRHYHHHHDYRRNGNYVGIPGVGGFVVGR